MNPLKALISYKNFGLYAILFYIFGNEATLIDYKSARPSVYVSSLWSYRSREHLLYCNIWMLSYYDDCLYQC